MSTAIASRVAQSGISQQPGGGGRGAFIVFEGLDRSGKTSQVERLVTSLQRDGIKTKGIRFPDRTTGTGKMIDAYLKQTAELDDHAVHLLFSANRWEKANSILQDLKEGYTVICDRYAFSGIAFTAAKGLDYTWCKSCDVGLPSPDLVLSLSVSPEIAAQRGGYGEERYESSEMQAKVRGLFSRIGDEMGQSTWRTVDAGSSMESVEEDIGSMVREVLEGRPLQELGKLWA